MYCPITIMVISILLLLAFVWWKNRKKFHNNLFEIIISLPSVLIGALLAIGTTILYNDIVEKNNYVVLLQSSIKMDEQYLSVTNSIVNTINSKPNGYFDNYRSLSNVKDPFLLSEIINKGYLYKYSSEKYKNYLPMIIFIMQSTDLTVSKDNLNTIKLFNGILKLKQKLFMIELKYILNDLNNAQVDEQYFDALNSSKNSLTNELKTDPYLEKFFTDSTNYLVYTIQHLHSDSLDFKK